MAAQRRRYRVDEMQEPIAELLLAGDKALNTRSPLYPLAEWLVPCVDCGAVKGEPCVPREGAHRPERAVRNHASHVARRRAAAAQLTDVLVSYISPEAGSLSDS